MSIQIKDASGIEGMRLAGRLAAEVLDYLEPHIKPGVTTNHILGFEAVLPDGTLVWLGTTPEGGEDVDGYDLRGAFIGCEGMFGVVTRVLVRLTRAPQAFKTMLGVFETVDDASQTVSDIIAAQIIPCTLEFLDRTTIHCVEDFAKVGLPLNCESLLLMETDGHPAAVEEEGAKMA